MADLKTILEATQTVAVVGCSDKPHRTSHKIAGYLKEVGYRMIPVNPHVEEVHGKPAYPNLQSIPADVHLDVVDIFRNPSHTAEMVEAVVERAKANGEQPTIWTQVGVSSSDAEKLARKAGLAYVKNRCMLVEHSRLIGTPAQEA